MSEDVLVELTALLEARGPLAERERVALHEMVARAERSAVARAQAELGERLQPFYDAIVSLAALDFTRRVPLAGDAGIADAIATGLNMLSEEIAARLTQERELRAQLMHADRLAAIGQLAAGVAHEVNNPATYIAANLETLHERNAEVAELITRLDAQCRRPEPDVEAARALLGGRDWPTALTECRALLEDSEDGMTRIVAIVRDLRAFSRVDAEREEAVSLDELLQVASRTVGKAIRYRATLVLDLCGAPPTLGHRARLTQVFTNLLANAAQAIEEGHSEQNRITITTRVEDGCVVAAISDTGRGIPAELQPRVFEPFFTTKPRDVGTGLGLSLAAEIVRQHGGAIALRSEPGVGTTFEVRLPLRAPPAPAPAPSAPAPTTERLRVLLIDDDAAVLKVCERALRGAFDLTTASSGREGLDRLAAGTFDVVLCDVMMPGLDGRAVYEEAARADATYAERFFFLSGGVFTDRTREFLAAHGDRTFDKPLDFKRLAAEIARRVRPR